MTDKPEIEDEIEVALASMPCLRCMGSKYEQPQVMKRSGHTMVIVCLRCKGSAMDPEIYIICKRQVREVVEALDCHYNENQHQHDLIEKALSILVKAPAKIQEILK